jgi:hypothetical protein
VQSFEYQLTFRRNISPPSSASDKPSRGLSPALTLVSCSSYSNLKMEAICSSETSVDFHVDCTLHNRGCEILKYCINMTSTVNKHWRMFCLVCQGISRLILRCHWPWKTFATGRYGARTGRSRLTPHPDGLGGSSPLQIATPTSSYRLLSRHTLTQPYQGQQNTRSIMQYTRKQTVREHSELLGCNATFGGTHRLHLKGRIVIQATK